MRLVCYFPKFLLVLDQPFFEKVESLQIFFLAERNAELFLFFCKLVLKCWQLCILLELEEGPGKDILKIDILKPLTVQKHVIVDIETTQ